MSSFVVFSYSNRYRSINPGETPIKLFATFATGSRLSNAWGRSDTFWMAR